MKYVLNDFPDASVVKNPPANAGDGWVQSLDQEDSHGEGNGSPLQYSSLENPMDRGAWQATPMESQSQT